LSEVKKVVSAIKVALGLMATSIKEFCSGKEVQESWDPVPYFSKFGKRKVARREILNGCQKLRPGKRPNGLLNGQPESFAVTGITGRPGAEAWTSVQRSAGRNNSSLARKMISVIK
jgi:hypothetical protein